MLVSLLSPQGLYISDRLLTLCISYVQHHGIPHPHPSTPLSSLARSVGQGFDGIQGTRTNAKHPQVHPGHIIPQQESDPKACTARNAFAGPTFCTEGVHYRKRKIGESVTVHASTYFQKPSECGTVASPWWSRFHPFLMILETQILSKLPISRVCEHTADRNGTNVTVVLRGREEID